MKKLLLAALLSTIALPALAVDFAQPIKLLDGTTDMRKEDKTILTMDDVVQTALLSSYQDEQNLDGVEKAKRFWLAKKIHDHRKDPDLSAEDIALIKKLVAKAFNPLVTGRCWEVLDPASVPK